MSSSSSGNLDQLPPEIQKAVVEGQPIRVFACRFKIAREGALTGLLFESLIHANGSSDEYRDIDRMLCEILRDQITKLPRNSLLLLETLSKIVPEMPVAQIDIYINLDDGGKYYWTVAGTYNPAMEGLPGFSTAFRAAGMEAIDLITEALV